MIRKRQRYRTQRRNVQIRRRYYLTTQTFQQHLYQSQLRKYNKLSTPRQINKKNNQLRKHTNLLGFNRNRQNPFRFKTQKKPKQSPNLINQLKVESNIVIPQPRKFKLQNPNIKVDFPSRLGQAFVISIREKRLTDFKERFGPWEKYVKHWPGVDGSKLNKDQMYHNGTLLPYNGRVGETSLRRGEIGCYLAHFSLWQHIVKNNIFHAFIMEDDVDISYSQEVANVMNKTFDDIERYNLKYDILYFGHDPRVDPERMIPGTEIGIPKDCQGCFAYCITLECAQKLVDTFMPIRGPIDMILIEKRDSIQQLSLQPALCWVIPVQSDTGTIW